MTTPLWVYWAFAGTLLFPVLFAFVITDIPAKRLRPWILPALLVALAGGGTALDRGNVSQDELMAAMNRVRDEVGGSIGPVGNDRVEAIVERELSGHPVAVSSNDVSATGPTMVSYGIDVSAGDDDGAARACLQVVLTSLTNPAPDVRLAETTVSSGACDD